MFHVSNLSKQLLEHIKMFVHWLIKGGVGDCKEDLAQWVSLVFKKALTTTKICKGFLAIGIWPLNPNAMASNATI
jgi:hypothetical protein